MGIFHLLNFTFSGPKRHNDLWAKYDELQKGKKASVSDLEKKISALEIELVNRHHYFYFYSAHNSCAKPFHEIQ